MGTIRIEVTAEDIEKGRPNRACECPVALAVQRLFPDAPNGDKHGVFRMGRSFGVGTWATHLTDDHKVPPEVADWITRFDNGLRVKPISFDLEIPSPQDASR